MDQLDDEKNIENSSQSVQVIQTNKLLNSSNISSSNSTVKSSKSDSTSKSTSIPSTKPSPTNKKPIVNTNFTSPPPKSTKNVNLSPSILRSPGLVTPSPTNMK
jgi:hypothetical protein